MATLNVADAATFRMDEFQIGALRSSVFGGETGSRSGAAAAGEQYFLGGSNLMFDPGTGVTTGSVSSITQQVSGVTAVAITGRPIEAGTFWNYVRGNETERALADIFGGDDDLTGGNGDDVLRGMDGADFIYGGAGGDTIDGGAGNDHLYGRAPGAPGPDGADSIFGGEGSDYLQGNAGADTLDGGNGSDRIFGGADNDRIFGGSGNDTINGNLGDDTVSGGEGNDLLRGGQGADSITGGIGNDVLRGDIGDDTLVGGAGFDILEGGAGNDRFVFAGGDAAIGAGGLTDVIADWQDGSDRLTLGFTPATVLQVGAQTSFAAAQTAAQAAITNNPGGNEVAAVGVGNDTYLFWSDGGGSTIDQAVKVNAVQSGVFGLSDFG